MNRTPPILAIASFFVTNIPALALIGVEDLTIDPPGAGVHGRPVTITLSGIWLDTCIPEFLTHEMGDGEITITAVNPGGPHIGCGDALTPWQLETTIGPLSHGVYDMFAQTAHYNWPDMSDIVLDEGPELFIEDYPIRFLLGDMNGDGQLDAFDVHPFELALSDVEAYRDQYLDVDPVEVGNFAEDTLFNAFDTPGFEQALAASPPMPVPEPATWCIWAVAVAMGSRRATLRSK